MEKLAKQLGELAGVVNAFSSEQVQLRVTEWILQHLARHEPEVRPEEPKIGSKKPGTTKILNTLISTGYFGQPRSLPEIADHIKTVFDSGLFYTNQISGVLLGLMRPHQLRRELWPETNGYWYSEVPIGQRP